MVITQLFLLPVVGSPQQAAQPHTAAHCLLSVGWGENWKGKSKKTCGLR